MCPGPPGFGPLSHPNGDKDTTSITVTRQLIETKNYPSSNLMGYCLPSDTGTEAMKLMDMSDVLKRQWWILHGSIISMHQQGILYVDIKRFLRMQ